MNQPRLNPWYLAYAALLAYLVYLLGPILSPFLFAAILAYICNPLANRLEKLRVGRWQFSRTLSVVLVMLLLVGISAALVLVLIPLVAKEAASLATRIPVALDWLRAQAVPWIGSTLKLDSGLDGEQLRALAADHWQSAGKWAAGFIPNLTSGGLAVLEWLSNLLLVPLVFFYLLRDWGKFLGHVDQLLPRRWHPMVVQIATEIDGVLAEFLRGQLAVMAVMAAFYSLALWVAGLEFALAIGVITGVLVFVPYLGVVVGLVLATLAGALQFGTVGGLIPVWIALAVGQLLEGMLVTPHLVGERIGLHPVAVIFALLAFGQLFGFVGLLLALPASAALLVGLRHGREGYLKSEIYNRQ